MNRKGSMTQTLQESDAVTVADGAQRSVETVRPLLLAIDQDSNDPASWLELLEALLLSQQYPEARDVLLLARTCRISVPALDAFARRLNEMPMPNGSNLMERERTVMGLLALRRFDECASAVAALLERYPEHGPAWKIWGAMLLHKGRPADAVQAMRRSTELLPEDPEARANLAIAITALNQARNTVEA